MGKYSCCFFLILVILDQFTKYFMSLKQPFLFFTPTVNGMLRYYNNYLLITVLCVSAYLCYFFRKNKRIYTGILLALIGSISNIIDFIIRGFVIDWVNIFGLPVFNLADVYIVLGSLIVGVSLLISDNRTFPNNKKCFLNK